MLSAAYVLAWLAVSAFLPLLHADDADAKKPTLGDVIDRAAESVVQINVSNAAGEAVGSGSGFVIDAKGRIATNYHVTRQGTKLVVAFRDGTKCEVTGYHALDRSADLAVVELAKPPAKLKPLPLGAKTPPRQGDSVIAIGHPRGLSFTVTSGIVSAVRKTSELPKENRDQLRAPADQLWIQTSAPISSGSSGGPLLDESGKVVGINTWVAFGQNLGFAIHVGHLKELLAKAPATPIPLTVKNLAADVENPMAEMEPRIEKMVREFRNAQREFETLLEGAKNEKEMRALYDSDNPGPRYAKRFYEIANSERKTTMAFQALVLACRCEASSEKPATLPRALDRLLEDHRTDKGLQYAVQLIARTSSPPMHHFLRRVIADSPHRPVRGMASLYLGSLLSTGDASQEAEALRLLEVCTKDYADLPLEQQTIGDFAKMLLHRIRFLSVGKKAQEITGEDVDGKTFKLSDYRGKVVVLDFFADWCPHCVHMYPHERRLVGKYADRPFVLLGVNIESKDTLRQLVADKKVTWRCWSDGEEGPIAKAWQVDSFPTLYLLDHEGVIRQILSGRPEERTLEKTIEEMVAKAGKPAPVKGRDAK
jgi:S1-C subfamily serine protease/peroxiredoxin